MYVDGVRVLECSGVLLFCWSSIMSASGVSLAAQSRQDTMQGSAARALGRQA